MARWSLPCPHYPEWAFAWPGQSERNPKPSSRLRAIAPRFSEETRDSCSAQNSRIRRSMAAGLPKILVTAEHGGRRPHAPVRRPPGRPTRKDSARTRRIDAVRHRADPLREKQPGSQSHGRPQSRGQPRPGHSGLGPTPGPPPTPLPRRRAARPQPPGRLSQRERTRCLTSGQDARAASPASI